MTDHDDEPGARTPPQDIQAEQSVLGGIMLAPDAIDSAAAILTGSDFYRPAHELIFDTALQLRATGEPIDATTMNAALTARGDIKRAGGAVYLHTLISTVPTAANVEFYARIVRDRATLRRLIAAGTRVVQLGYSPARGDTDQAVTTAIAEVQAVSAGGLQSTARSLDEIADAAIDQIEAGIQATPTSWQSLNWLINGWVDATLVGIGARPGVGKTVFALQAFREYGEAQLHGDGRTAAYFALEMSPERLYQRTLAGLANVDWRRLRSGELQNDEWTKVARADGHMRSLPLAFEGASGWTARQIITRCRALHRDNPLGFVVVDHIGLTKADTKRENRQAELSEAADAFLALAHELNTTVVIVTQLNRQSTQRADQRPVPSDIRDTDRIEQNVDVLMLLHRDKDKAPSELWVSVAKNRDGAEGAFRLDFDGGRAQATEPKRLQAVRS